jgi:hypothetical protein
LCCFFHGISFDKSHDLFRYLNELSQFV